MSINARYEEMRKLNVCLNCCKNSGCKKCFRKHNSLLHFGEDSKTDNDNGTQAEVPIADVAENTIQGSQNIVSPTTLASYVQRECYVLLATASIYVSNSNGELIRCRALLSVLVSQIL